MIFAVAVHGNASNWRRHRSESRLLLCVLFLFLVSILATAVAELNIIIFLVDQRLSSCGMTVQNAATPSSSSLDPPKLSGFRTALRYTGIPPSWFNKRPKLPSRNWRIFLSLVSSVTGLYIYDRRECKRIKQHYIDLVKDQGDELLVDHFDWPRRVIVYASKWPGDDDYDQGMRYFRKYVKVGANAPPACI